MSLPEDADQNGIEATFRKGVLTVTLPKKSMPKSGARQIEVRSA